MSNVAKPKFDQLQQLVSERPLSSFKMAAFDLDGTLLGCEHQLSERTIASIKRVAEAGLIVLLATGRMTSAVKNHLENLGTPELVVSHNGALVKGARTGRIYYHETIPKPIISELLELLAGKDTVVHFNFDDDIYLVKANPYSEQYSKDLEISLPYVSSFRHLEGEPTTVLLMDRKDVLVSLVTALHEQFKKSFSYVIVQWLEDVWRLQLRPPNISKGKAVIEVAKTIGVLPKEIISFGDNYNDIEMLASTGLSIAMGNAVPEVKQIADFVTLSNQEDGVAYVLENLFNRERVWSK